MPTCGPKRTVLWLWCGVVAPPPSYNTPVLTTALTTTCTHVTAAVWGVVAAGPGAQCDGEDWFSISTIPQLDYTTIHVYERHMELLPRPSGAVPYRAACCGVQVGCTGCSGSK